MLCLDRLSKKYQPEFTKSIEMVTFVESIIYIDKIMEILGISNPEEKKKSAEVIEENQESSPELKDEQDEGERVGDRIRLTSNYGEKPEENHKD